ncbi:CHAD domain-containing protein [Pseudonocardia sp. DSM 110487]|uniref:CYTH and CHAD domain-containing protein n=1 Tax=Pseudonocardia sp. DSM 110487 TaxID=2865833 RepID=UPI001C6A170E|nr:CHAD domain-containing protein [Pseudonocardia sp. DSM 110487]QYN34319.1 CHAD domain-containing protein [Pseudonocardia sp. DSM 110487]
MTDTTTRTESQIFRGAPEAGSPRLDALPGVHREDAVPQHVLEIERFDTADHRLAAAGITLAVHRNEGEQSYWRLDLPDDDSGEELRVPLAPDAPPVPEVPGELAELVRGVVRDGELRPAGQVRRVRTGTRLLGGDDRLLGTVFRDHVTVATLGSSTEGGAWTEVRTHDTSDDGLAAELERRLGEAGLRPAATSADAELDRLLRPVAPPRRRSGGKRAKAGTAGAALLDYLATHVDRLAAEDLRARRGEHDSVHQLRVATRRLRSALQSYRRLLDRERTDPLVDALRELARALAPARDAEVLHARIRDGLLGLEPELLLGPVQAQVTRHYARVEGEATAAVLSALDGDAYARLRRDLDDLLQDPPLTKRAARPADKELPAHVARAAGRLSRAVEVAVDQNAEAEDRDLAVHDARKAGKRLRYATEVARPAVGKDAKRFAKELKGFQDALGEHQDTVVAREALRELAAEASGKGENGFAFGVLHGLDAARAARIEEELPDLWARAWRPRNRRWLS